MHPFRTPPANPPANPPAKYRLNRRAAFVLSAVFLLVGSAAGFLCWYHLQPERRLQYLRASAHDYLQNRHWKQAAIQLGNVVMLAPEDADAWFQLGAVHLEMLREVDPDTATNTAHLKAAVACYRRAAELAPDNLVVLRWLLELDLRGGNWRDARDRVAALARLAPDDPLLPLARDLMPSAQPETIAEARRLLRERESRSDRQVVELLAPFYRATPDDMEILGALAVAQARLGHHAELRELLEKTTQEYPCRRLEFVRAECALESGDEVTAIGLANSLLEVPALSLSSRGLLAEAHTRAARRETVCTAAAFHRGQALRRYREVLESAPRDDRAANNLAWILGQNGQIDEALALLAERLPLGNQWPPALQATYGSLLARAGRHAEALEPLERAAIALPGDRDVTLNLARAYLGVGNTSAARGLLQELALEANTNHNTVLTLLAMAK